MNDGIAYQNKDIISKTFMEAFGSKSLEVYGLKVPKVVRLLPTNLPAVEANELRIDNLLELEDGSVAVLDYESGYSDEDKAKYLNYMARVYKRYAAEGKGEINIRMIVIYTADVTPEQVKTQVQKSGFSVTIEAAYLSELDSEEIWSRLSDKVRRGERLTDAELMEFIILPLTYRTQEKKREIIKESIDIAKQISDGQQANFIIAGIVVFSDKIIDSETKEMAKEWIKMTAIGRMFEQEKEEAVRQARTEAGKKFEQEKEEAVEMAKQEEEQKAAKQIVKMIDSLVKNTNQTVEEICIAAGIDKKKYNEAKRLVAAVA